MKDDKPLQPLAHRPADVCRILGIGNTKFYELVNSGELPIIKLDGLTLVSDEACRALLERNACGPEGLRRNVAGHANAAKKIGRPAKFPVRRAADA
ncbi:helix-turn-helix domain-containing protein [Rhodanobacter lindaniclasticus]